MRVVEGEVFLDEHLVLNGIDARACAFDGCIVEAWSGGSAGQITNCAFHYCLFRGDGWTPEFLEAAIRSGRQGFTAYVKGSSS